MPRNKFPHLDDAVLLAAALRPPMDRWECRAQAISFAAYNVLLDKPVGTDPWPYVIGAAHAHDQAYGVWRDGERALNRRVHLLETKRKVRKKLDAKSKK